MRQFLGQPIGIQRSAYRYLKVSRQIIHIVGQMNKPIFSFYYHSHPMHCSKDLDEVRSNATQRTSYLSSRSPTSTKLHFARKDQIHPTRPIIPKPHQPTHQKLTTEPHLPKPCLDIAPCLDIEAQKIEEPHEPKHNNGFLGWKIMDNFCGVSEKKQSASGCICESPCKYRSEWSKQVRPQDRATYAKLRELQPSESNILQVSKDINRTYPQNPTFSKNPKFRHMLREVLLTYSVYDPELGYVQGVNLIAAILLYHIKSGEETFWALVDLMEQQELRMIYVGNLEHLRLRCSSIEQIFSKHESCLYGHMVRVGVNINCFLDGWLLSLMSKMIPLELMHLVIDQFRNHGWHYLYSLIVCFLRALKDYLLITQDESEFLMTLSEQNWKESGIDWLKVITQAKLHLKS